MLHKPVWKHYTSWVDKMDTEVKKEEKQKKY